MLLLIFIWNLMGKAGISIVDTARNWITAGIVLYPFPYLYLAMKRFYNDRRLWLTLRYLILLFLSGSLIIMLFLLFALFALIH